MAVPVDPNEVPRSLICSICLGLTEEPAILKSCSHVFCKPCIERSIITPDIDHKKACPICRSEIGKGHVLPLEDNRFAHRLWSGIPVRCEHHEECGWTGSAGDYRSHRESCVHHVIPSLREEIERLRSEHENARRLERERSKSRSEELERLKSKIKGLEYQLMSSNSEKDDLKKKIERQTSLTTTKKKLMERNRELRKDLVSKGKQIRDLHNTLTECKNQADKTGRLIAEQDEAKKKLEAENRELKKELEAIEMLEAIREEIRDPRKKMTKHVIDLTSAGDESSKSDGMSYDE